MKIFVYLMSALMLVTTAEAKKKNNKNGAEQAKKSQVQKEKERKERDEKRDTIQKFLDAKDLNHDGSVTLDEFLSDESDKEAASKRFEESNKNHDRYLSKSEISTMLGL